MEHVYCATITNGPNQSNCVTHKCFLKISMFLGLQFSNHVEIFMK